VGKNGIILGQQELNNYTSKKEFEEKLLSAGIHVKNLKKEIKYEEELEFLQVELVKLQQWLTKTNKRVVIIFEGRDAAGKGGTIRRFKEHLSPRSMRVVALAKPSDIERGQWYFMRYIKELPKPGEIVFFDRSWYNRAVVEPVMGFCTAADYEKFIHQVSEFEHMLYEDGISIVKFWFSIAKKEQLKRFESRKTNPLKQWKLSPVDVKSRSKWDEYTVYKEKMFVSTHTSYCPWILVNADDKLNMRLESMRYVLNLFDYKGKSKDRPRFYPDPNIIQRYSRSLSQLDG
jgi:polyphosphate kinase 2